MSTATKPDTEFLSLVEAGTAPGRIVALGPEAHRRRIAPGPALPRAPKSSNPTIGHRGVDRQFRMQERTG